MLEMYPSLLMIHGAFRWVVLLAALAAIVAAVIGLVGRRPFAPLGRGAGVIYVAAMDLQLLLGLLLYAASPLVRAAWSNLKETMKNHDLRFFAVEHLTLMIIAVALVHVGSVRAKRASDARLSYRRMLVWNAASLIIIILGTPWARPFFRGLAGG